MASKMTEAGIIITQGDTLNIPLRFTIYKDGKKVPLDIANAVLRMQVRASSSTPPLISKEVNRHADESGGRSLIQLTAEDTNIPAGDYYTDIEIQFPDGQKFTFYPPKAGYRAYFKVVEQFTKGD